MLFRFFFSDCAGRSAVRKSGRTRQRVRRHRGVQDCRRTYLERAEHFIWNKVLEASFAVKAVREEDTHQVGHA
jgi:hypothetical protein